MPLSRMLSVGLFNLEPVLVEVEVDVSPSDKTTLIIVGLPDTAVKESKERVLTAIKNSGYSTARTFCTINLAPGDLKKEGALYDLPIALGLLRSMEALKTSATDDYLFIGELGLGGELRPIHGALPSAMLARSLGKKGILLPAANAKEAAALPGILVYAIEHLNDAVQFLKAPHAFQPLENHVSESLFKQTPPLIDFEDIKGQFHVKRALEIAAAGGHNVILSGPPGSGKTMLAKSLPGIIPELSLEEALEITKIHSISGLVGENSQIITQRPFRSPHHTVSYAGLIGGGSVPRPGEVSLAHRGVLFLDELPEFSRTALEVLRQPLEDRKVTISRALGNFTFPSDFICIAAMNPCPCGYHGHPDRKCKDTLGQIDRYQSKISGPLLDRIDMHITVPALRYSDISEKAQCESSHTVRQRVEQARKKQEQRFGTAKINAQMSSKELKEHIHLSAECHDILREAVDSFSISTRACERVIRVALTIADLSDSACIETGHLLEALALRNGIA